MNTCLLMLSIATSFGHLFFNADMAWFVKESMANIGMFFTAIVIYNMTRRRHFRIRKLGLLYLIFFTSNLLLHLVDTTLMYLHKDAMTDLLISKILILEILVIVAYLTFGEMKEWMKKKLRLHAEK